jgi:ADP-heptose:LPS heptosyltransferase
VRPDYVRILIVKLFPTSELFHALPTVHRLRRAYGAKIDWVVHEQGAELVACFDDVDRVIVYPEDELKHVNRRDFRKALHQETYDLVVDLQGAMQSALVCKSARKSRGAAVLGPSFQTEGACFMYTATTGIRDRDRHPVVECMDVLRYLKIPTTPVAFPLRFPMPFLGRSLPPSYVVCSLDGARKRDRLAAAFWIETVQRLNVPVVLLGGRDSEDLADEIEDSLLDLPIYNFVHQINLAEQGGVMQAAETVIACDALSVHMAAYLSCPTVALFGSGKSTRMQPFDSLCSVIEGSNVEPEAIVAARDELKELRGEVVSF